MIRIVETGNCKERRVKLNNEGIRYSDVRRWMIGEEAFNGNIYGMNLVEQKER